MEIVNDEKIVVEVNGEKKEYDVLFSFDLEDKNKSYIVYTDHSMTDNGEENIFVSSYDIDIGPVSFNEVSEEEKKMVDEIIKDISDNLNWGDLNE